MSDHLLYGTRANEFAKFYPKAVSPFKTDSRTQLPRSITAIRTVAALAFTGFTTYNWAVSGFVWPAVVAVAVVGVAFTGWTLYTHLFRADPMLETFHKICGSKKKFNQLPELKLNQKAGEKLFSAISDLQWDQLKHPISRAKTLDGRTIVIVKGLSRHENWWDLSHQKTQAVFAFVERAGPFDVPRKIPPLHEIGDMIAQAILFPFTGNRFESTQGSSFSTDGKGWTRLWEVSPRSRRRWRTSCMLSVPLRSQSLI